MKIDLTELVKINLEQLTKEIQLQLETVSVGRVQKDNADFLIIQDSEKLTKEQRQLIKSIIEAHAPERDDQEEVEFQELKRFDKRVKESLIRLGIISKDGL
jgi:hypothetical protein